MPAVKILAKGQLVIPAKLRKKYHIRHGSELQILEYGGMLHLIPPVTDPIKAAAGFLPKRPSLAKKLLKEHQKDFA
ncbi:MAG: AbrB/MazE/SpoVT family DNA-binding domain-containing protein [Candidatus Tectomicrobia bacterium]|uniref:AbrB/MazE/SpoVT family DNA-binding domain-containing protein n=1 Tax=Tectimicrobiota bacterium TaxID=2528274 RepID=A0A932M2G9_UNCTE|nr:AbrB/MazE/SpoVT family DNA-binding domain-containing protein [Candidatus Tectomicrobia bacterium]